MSAAKARPSINDSWQALLERYDIPAHIARDGSYIISADTINTVREARLMAKFDEYRSVPECLRTRAINILPIGRGTYILGAFETFADIDYPRQHPVPIQIPALDTLDADSIHSEAEALLFLNNSEILQTVFGSTTIHTTMSGRRASGNFGFSINRQPHTRQAVAVENAQIEIDAGYETPDAVFVCEAKNRHVTDMNVRQLYYPYRFAQQKTKKPVIPFSVIYSNQTFYITRYAFADPLHYNSLTIEARYCYALHQRGVRSSELFDRYTKTPPPDASRFAQIPFPQADNFTLIWRLCEALAQRPYTSAEVTAFIGYASRQSDYYLSAGRALGMIERFASDAGTAYRLTTRGHTTMQAPPDMQKKAFIAAMYEIPCFYELFLDMFRTKSAPTKERIIDEMQNHPFMAHNTPVTIHRRASTVWHWLKWAVDAVTVWD